MIRQLLQIILGLWIVFWTIPLVGAETSTLESAFRSEIASELKYDNAEIQIDEIKIRGEPPKGNYSVDILEAPPFGQYIRGRISPENGDRDKWVRLDTTIKVMVPVVKQDVTPQSSVRDVKIGFEQRPLDKLPHDVIKRRQLEQPFIFRNRLESGSIISKIHLKKPVVVQRDDVVTIKVKRGAITITDRGVARESARVGDSVRVKSKTSNQIIEAIATNDGTVEVP